MAGGIKKFILYAVVVYHVQGKHAKIYTKVPFKELTEFLIASVKTKDRCI